jgi:hypothetical protein
MRSTFLFCNEQAQRQQNAFATTGTTGSRLRSPLHVQTLGDRQRNPKKNTRLPPPAGPIQSRILRPPPRPATPTQDSRPIAGRRDPRRRRAQHPSHRRRAPRRCQPHWRVACNWPPPPRLLHGATPPLPHPGRAYFSPDSSPPRQDFFWPSAPRPGARAPAVFSSKCVAGGRASGAGAPTRSCSQGLWGGLARECLVATRGLVGPQYYPPFRPGSDGVRPVSRSHAPFDLRVKRQGRLAASTRQGPGATWGSRLRFFLGQL